MIELLNARRMILVIVVLILLCIIIVVWEESITDNVDRPAPYLEYYHNDQNLLSDKNLHSNRSDSSSSSLVQNQVKKIVQDNRQVKNNLKPHISIMAKNHCWMNEKFQVKSKCLICTRKEHHLDYCLQTGHKEEINCEKSGIVFRSCDDIKESLFYVFEFFMLCMSFVFCFYAQKRQSYLNRMILNRIEKQISSGV
ncbi:hypothetical protein SSS_10769 [Sarcoptes scabiei]|uniref:Uncharacterized protein n=1 Tax=Sarcoptes scabiei TaxID=52283 RepID=A0A834R108_SARSC|nr:hypothetical protein SSS_10769 [Sarcoptes scabiei]UXI17304.1 26S proteasome non-ATPase regulatory [Sarcoptes scabiei]